MRKLTETAVKKLRPKQKNYYVCDGDGLNVSVMPNGTKYWILRYTKEGKESKKSLGKYPQVSLAEARDFAHEMKKQIRSGTFKSGRAQKVGDTFGAVAEEWLDKKIRPALSREYIQKTSMRLEKHIIPILGGEDITSINSRKVLEVCRGIEDLGTIDTAHRVRQIIGQVFRYAIAAGYADSDPTGALIYKGRKIIKLALLFSALTFCRPGEIRRAEWDEVDFEKREWKIPAAKMKMRRIHIVPLSVQAVDVLKEAFEITGGGKHIFAPLSEGAVRFALRSMGYSPHEMTAHGFRGMASTMLSEQGWPPEIIERQLAHVEKSASRAAYCHAEYLPERQRMMQSWGDYLKPHRLPRPPLDLTP